MRICVFIAVLFLIQSLTFAASERGPDQPKETFIPEGILAWKLAGYSLDHLGAELGFTAEDCSADLESATGCLVALDFMARLLPEPLTVKLQTLPETGETSYVLEPLNLEKEGQPYESLEAVAAVRESLIESAQTAGIDPSSPDPQWIEELRAEIFQMTSEVDEDRVPYIAARVYTRFLHETGDPHTGLILDSVLNEKPKPFSGIGAELRSFIGTKSGQSEIQGGAIARPFPDSPSRKAGLSEGDIIIAVDGQDIRGLNLRDIVEPILGPAGTTVTLTVHSFCEGVVKDIVVTRGRVKRQLPNSFRDSRFVPLDGSAFKSPKAALCESLEDVEAEPADNASVAAEDADSESEEAPLEALYIPVKSFGPESCLNFKKALDKDLGNPNSVGVIVDLRGNGGGRVSEVACMLDSLVVDDGIMYDSRAVELTSEGLVVTDNQYVDHYGPEVGFYSPVGRLRQDDLENIMGVRAHVPPLADGIEATFTYNRKVVVLIDQNSASASEIFAGSIQDKARGWVLGVQSYGKGTIQLARPHLPETPDDLVYLKRTIAIYVLASGRSPQHEGITPDFPASPDGSIYTAEDIAALRAGGESSLYNAIKYNTEPWVQPRPDAVEEISECLVTSDSATQAKDYVANLTDSDKAAAERTFIGNYQDALALGVLTCSEERSDVHVVPVQF